MLLQIYICICIYTSRFIKSYKCSYVCTYICMHIYMYKHIYNVLIYVHAYMCIYLHTYMFTFYKKEETLRFADMDSHQHTHLAHLWWPHGMRCT